MINVRQTTLMLIKSTVALLAAALMMAAIPDPSPAQPAPAPQNQENTNRSPAETTTLIHDLMAGKLAPNIDPHVLFQASFGNLDTLRTKLLLTLLNDPKLLKQARNSVKALPELTPDLAALTIAQAEFLTLPEARRRALLDTHRRRAEKASEAQNRLAAKTAILKQLTRRADGLQAFLDGQPANPEALAIDFLDPAEAALDKSRRKTLLAPATANNEAEKSTIDGQIAAQTTRIDRLRGEILALPAEKRAQLIKAAAAPMVNQTAAATAQAAAEEAARAAAEAAERTKNETARLLEGERNKLMAIRQAQAQFELTLTQREEVTGKIREIALGWRRQVRELQARSAFDPTRKIDADRLYFKLVDALRNLRSDLDTALKSSGPGVSATLDPPQLDQGILRDPIAAAALQKLHQQLLDNAIRLRGLDTSLRWSERTSLMDAMAEMNEVRLSLIDDLSSSMRSQIVGFGEAGVAQAGRELNQIILVLRYNILYLPQTLDKLTHPLLHPTPRLVLSLIQLLLVILIFKYWREHGDTVLVGMQRSARSRRPQTVASTALAAGITYFRQARRPFDWFILILLLGWLLPAEINVTGTDYVWMIASWLLAAAFLVQLSDALAQGNRRNDPHAVLRQQSLRLVAGVIIVVGLMLSLTSQTVGSGAIYHWVFSACWLLVIPVALLLASWWRDEISALAASGAPSSPILAWYLRNQDGPPGYLTRIIAGAALLLAGSWGILIRRANDIALIREIADQRARSRAAARVAADEASGRFRPLTSTLSEALDPHHHHEINELSLPNRAKTDFPKLLPGGLVAIIGERGLGKTSALDDMLQSSATAEHIRLQCREGGYPSLLADLGKALGKVKNESAIISRLSQPPFRIITIDDVQRLIIPAIGGLRDFDSLVSLARASGDATSWAISIGGPAWSYVSRARSDRTIFDQIITLPRWEPAKLRALIEHRTKQAGLDPEFDRLEHTGLVSFDSDITPEERIKRAYFSSLAEYCEGNPAMALEFWRRSLFEDTASGRITVRTFATPSARILLTLPQTTIFVLRAIIQIEVATPEAIQRGTDLSLTLVTDALRSLNRIGIIKAHEHGYRVALFWYRDAIRLLERQNLLVRGAT